MLDEKRLIEIEKKFAELENVLALAKPNDRSEVDRRFAIVMTDLEKSIAYYSYYIMAYINGTGVGG